MRDIELLENHIHAIQTIDSRISLSRKFRALWIINSSQVCLTISTSLTEFPACHLLYNIMNARLFPLQNLPSVLVFFSHTETVFSLSLIFSAAKRYSGIKQWQMHWQKIRLQSSGRPSLSSTRIQTVSLIIFAIYTHTRTYVHEWIYMIIFLACMYLIFSK